MVQVQWYNVWYIPTMNHIVGMYQTFLNTNFLLFHYFGRLHWTGALPVHQAGSVQAGERMYTVDAQVYHLLKNQYRKN